MKSDDGFNTKITNIIVIISIILEIITNRIEINVISRVNATITIRNHFTPVDFIDFNSFLNQISNSNNGFNTREFNYFNSICNDYNSICNDYNYICKEYNSFEIDDIRFLWDPVDESV